MRLLHSVKKLLTRREVIQYWQESSKFLDYLCCPSCRTILTKENNGSYFCGNEECLWFEIRINEKGEKL